MFLYVGIRANYFKAHAHREGVMVLIDGIAYLNVILVRKGAYRNKPIKVRRGLQREVTARNYTTWKVSQSRGVWEGFAEGDCGGEFDWA